VQEPAETTATETRKPAAKTAAKTVRGAKKTAQSEEASQSEKDAEEQRYRGEVIQFLKAAGVDFDENAPIEELEEKMNATPE
jgi:hypothetical protein